MFLTASSFVLVLATRPCPEQVVGVNPLFQKAWGSDSRKQNDSGRKSFRQQHRSNKGVRLLAPATEGVSEMAPKAIGYARTSTARQTGGIEAQVLALKEAEFFAPSSSRSRSAPDLKEKERPQLQARLLLTPKRGMNWWCRS